MRAIIAFFMVIALAGLGVHGCAGIVSGAGGGGEAHASERVIRAEPAQIVEAMHRSLRSDGMELVSRSDTGDHYRLAFSAAEMRANPELSRFADQGELVMNARVTRRQIEFTSTFTSGLVAGFTIDMSPAADGSGTLARVAPLLRAGGRERDRRFHEALNRNWARYGKRVLETIADASES